jgi:CDGSH-type Zn-finger protein/uncharacterized Fe-S cluster protein YjdI
MEKKIHTYESEDITIEFDSKRCLHSSECVKGLDSVFDPNKRPWIQPENASADQIKEVVHRCPTGALQYKNANSEEKPDRRNSITISPDGPLYLRGNIEIQNAEGETILEDTRAALCRCGASDNKPLCDNSHEEIDFEAPAGFDDSKLRPTDSGDFTKKLVLKLMNNGPILVDGKYKVYSIGSRSVNSTKNVAFCRCGHSGTKPFCDGSHKEVGFEG